MALVTSNPALESQLTDWATTLGAGSELHLYQNNYTPTPASVAGDFTEATFSGYASIDISADWTAPAQIASGRYQIETDSYTFQQNGGATTNTIYGWYISDGAGVIYHAEKFAAPFSMGTGASLPLRVRVTQEAKSVACP